MSKKLINVIYYALIVLVKNRDGQGLLFFNQNLINELTKKQFNDVIINFFHVYENDLTQEDVIFFENTVNGYTENKNKEPVVPKTNKLDDDKHLRKIKKGVALFERIGWKLGVDYSFKDGDFYMTSLKKRKLREILQNNAL